MTTKPKVEMHNAYLWVCDACGRDNFERAIVGELDIEEREQAFRHFERLDQWAELPEGWQDFTMMTYPDAVTCQHCGETFETVAPHSDDGCDD